MIFNFKNLSAYGQALKSTSNDIGELSKLTSNLTLSQTAHILSTRSLTKEKMAEILVNKGLTQAEAEATAAKIASTSANGVATFSFKAYTAAIWENITATITWMATNPVGWILGIGAAIAGAIIAYDIFNESIEEQKEKLEELNEEYKSAKNELNALNTELQDNNKIIDELQDKKNDGTITLIEEDELKKLKITNELLLQQIELKEKLAQKKRKELSKENVETFNNEYNGSLDESYENNSDIHNKYGVVAHQTKSIDDKTLILLAKENNDRLKKALFSNDSEMVEILEEDKIMIMEELEGRSDDILLSLLGYQEKIAEGMNADGTFANEMDKKLWNDIESWKRGIYEYTNRSGEWNTLQIKAAIDENSLTDIQTNLANRINTLTPNDIDKTFGLNVALQKANLILEDGQTPASIYLQYLKSIAKTQNEISSATPIKIFSFDEVLSGLEESYTTLESVKKEWTDTGKVSVDSIQDIMSKFPGLTDLLSDYVQDKKDEQDIVDALSEEYATDLKNYKLYIAQKNGDDEQFYDNIVDNLSQDLINKAEYYGITLKDYASYNEAKLAIDKEYELKKAKLQKTEDAVYNKFDEMIEEGYGIDKPFPFNDILTPALFANYEKQKRELAEYEEFIKDFDTSITVEIPDFNLDLFGGDDDGDAKEFSDSIDWAANSISNLEREISKLNDTIADTTDIDKKIELLKELKTNQEKLATLKGNTVEEYKEQYDDSLKELTPAQRKKYKKLIESNDKAKIEDFEGENKEELYNKVTNSQSKWQAYQQAVTDHESAKKDVDDTDKTILDTDNLERSQQEQEELEKELDTVNEKLNDSTLSTKDKNDLLEQQYNLQKGINDELRTQAKYEKDNETLKKLDAEDKNIEYNYNSSIYESNKEDVIRKVGINDNEIKDIQNDIDIAGKGTVEQYKSIIGLQEGNIGYWETQKDYAFEMREANKDNAILYQQWDNELQDCEDNIHAMNTGIKEMEDAILNIASQEIELKLQSINKEINSCNRELDEQTELINAATAIFDEEIEKQNLIKEGIQDKIDALQEEKDLRNANLNVQKAQYELEKARSNKTTKVFREGVGFVFEADQEAIQEAQKNYDENILTRKIQLLNEEIKRVDDNIESLSKQKKQWEDIIPLMERAALITKAEAYDMDFKNKVLSGNVGLLTTIRDRYGEIYSEIGQLEETKKPYELLQEELTGIAQYKSLGGISYDEALEQTKSAISQYYPELLSIYEEQTTSLDEIAKNQLESVGVTEETSEENKEEIKNTNEEITQSYNDLLTNLTDVFTQLETLMTSFSRKAMTVASSVVSSVSAISSAISTTGTVADKGVKKINNTLPKEYQKIDDSTLNAYNNIARNLNTSLIPNIPVNPVGVLSHVSNTNANKNISVSVGDVYVNDVQDATGFAKTIVNSLPNAMKQELYKI